MKKHMKKGIALILTMALAASLTACSYKTSGTDETDNSTSELLPVFDKSLGIEETELTRTRGVIITATELSYSSYEATLCLTIENTSKKEKTVCSGTMAYCVNSVNGYMIHDGYLNIDIAPGEIKEEEMRFGFDEMYACGHSKIADIEVGFEIHDGDKKYKTGPISVRTNAADSYDYKTDTYLKAFKGKALQSAYGFTIDSLVEKKLYAEGGISLISEAVMTNQDGNSILMLEFESHAEQSVNIRLSNLSINGIEVEDSYLKSDMICTGKRDIIAVNLKSYMKENTELKGKKVKNVSFKIKLQNEDYKDLTQSQKITVTF